MICLVFCLLLAVVTTLTIIGASRAARSKDWPVTEGVVIAFHETPNYQYRVNGATFVSDTVSCNELFGFSRALTDSEKYSLRYPLQAKVTVHYHPAKPEIGVLEKKFDRAAWKRITLLVAMTLLLALGFSAGGRMRTA
jgi:hypothetical protein